MSYTEKSIAVNFIDVTFSKRIEIDVHKRDGLQAFSRV